MRRTTGLKRMCVVAAVLATAGCSDLHVLVTFDGDERAVILDGNRNGFTGTPFRIEAGTHTFSLAGEKDFEPCSQTCRIGGGSGGSDENAPYRVCFRQVKKSGAATCEGDGEVIACVPCKE